MEFVQKSQKDIWQTPPEVYEPIREKEGCIDLDPCAAENTNIAQNNYTLPEDDGLLNDWFGISFVNPPFSLKKEFLKKAVQEYKYGNLKRAYILLPDSTDAKSWWHEYIASEFEWSWFPEGRINYIDPDSKEQVSGVSFGSSVSVLGNPPEELLYYWNKNGDVVHRPFVRGYDEGKGLFDY